MESTFSERIYKQEIQKGGIFISDIEITISHDTPHDFFRNLIVLYPTGTYKRPIESSERRDTNWFVLKVKSETFVKQFTSAEDETPEVKLVWFAREKDGSLMEDWRADPVNYTP